MNIEMLPGLDNVVRFPIELRVAPSMAVLYDIAPDPREVLLIAESYQLEPPNPDLAHQVDAETARYVAEQVLPLAPSERPAALSGLLDPVVRRAVEACGDADRVSKQLVKAEQALLHARTESGSSPPLLEAAANALSWRAAELLILAHERCQEARGVNRAVGLARRGETWTPYSAAETSDWLVEAGLADRGRRASSV